MDISLPLLLAQAGGGGGLTMVGYVVALLAIMYFLLIRPQQKQAKEHRALVQNLKKGDEVVTQSGIIGKIHSVAEKEVALEIANGVRVRFLKTAVQGRVQVPASVEAKAEEKKEEK